MTITIPEFGVWYSHLKLTHIALVIASGGLFTLRGALVLAGHGWAMARHWRLLSYGIDTLLLIAGVTLWVQLSLNPMSSTWLGAKLLLLVLYVVLGSLALKRARTPMARLGSYIAALMVYALMGSVAHSHHPLGFLQPWLMHVD
ncbi:SirB2 family protein [Ideonella sp.]|uniref:SirB2 family protein n=1 Tax=Ideonella sp. TaxID=1929293 RepID=UPI003BB533E9